jgi:hypothetical protein
MTNNDKRYNPKIKIYYKLILNIKKLFLSIQ